MHTTSTFGLTSFKMTTLQSQLAVRQMTGNYSWDTSGRWILSGLILLALFLGIVALVAWIFASSRRRASLLPKWEKENTDSLYLHVVTIGRSCKLDLSARKNETVNFI
ncbi:hypothetical protein GQ53DRAFT_12155 [Thozetella sp. PMI_491]|nr:hypothetical protein GQ53DRAFT_12155 [Thozetella sp. PMI_491]